MASRIVKSVVAVVVLVVGTGGYLLYKANAAQAEGSLAQAPLNNQVQTPPAFIMALDNSGSMRTDETLFRTGNGRGFFRYSNNSFFNGANLWTSTGGSGFGIFAHMTTDDGWNSNRNADTYGALRSPEHNRAYFNPHVIYTPWLKGDETYDNDALVTAAPPDPRGSCSTGSRCLSNNSSKFADATYDFTTYRQVTETWRKGFVMPVGTEYYNNAWCNTPSGSPTNGWRTLSSDLTFSSNCETTFRYYPARVYLSLDAPPPSGFDLTRRVLIKGIGPSGSDMYRYDIIASNFSSGGAEAAQNFANWWTYYGNRNRALIAGITNSLKGLSNMRVAAFEFVNPPDLDDDLTMHDMGSPAEKATLINTVRSLRANGGSTPSRRGTAYMLNQFHRTDSGAPVKYECQRNAAMLFTDGYTNESGSSSADRLNRVTNYFDVGDQDHSLGGPYGGPPYSGGAASQNTIADYAMWGYITNPRPLMPAGRVPVPASCPGAGDGIDCNPNLHVNFYGVTLGARGAIYDVNVAATSDPFANPPNWGATSYTNLDPANVDDIWHASLNGRGEFINANTPRDITAAMRRILQKVSSGASPSGSIAMTGARIGGRSLSVIPSYEITNEGTDWHSYLHATKPTLDLTTGVVTETGVWEASGLLTGSGRGGHTWFGNSSGGASLFNSSNIADLDAFCSGRPYLSRCTGAELAGLVADVDEAIDYFLGDQSNEVANGGSLRDRTTVLGDIINSTPVISAPTDDYGYRALPSPYGASYDTYMTSKEDRPVMVYVGANDGMLHAFHGGIDHEGNPMGAGGEEQFAYIPRTVLGHMGNLLFPYVPADGGDQKFDHRYYVDGPITVGDAYIGMGWKSVLVGTTGAGGRSVFALDVSDPTNFTSGSRLWEIDDQHSNADVARNIGHVLGKPVIAPFRDPGTGEVSWKAIFGNGYESLGTDCSVIPPTVCEQNAVLFVVDLATGDVRMIKAEESGAPAGPNGLGNIVVVDRKQNSATPLNIRDGFADTVYATDRKGAVWRFDLLDTSNATLTVPLFVTQTVEGDKRQPIIGGLTATAGRGGGVMVLFGTGSFSFVGDSSDTTLQSLYGIQDVGGTVSTTLTVSDLFEREIAVDLVTGARTISPGGPSIGHYGWYLNLPDGERMVSYPRVASGTVFIPTYAPTAASGCSTGGENWMYGLNTRTGAPALDSVRFGSTSGETAATIHGANSIGALELTTSGSAPVKDVAVSVVSTSRSINPGEHRCWMRVTVAGMAQAMLVPYPCGRQSWRELQ